VNPKWVDFTGLAGVMPLQVKYARLEQLCNRENFEHSFCHGSQYEKCLKVPVVYVE